MKKLTIKEASDYFSVTEQSIWKRIERGMLDYSKENGYLFVHVEDDIASEQEQKTFKAKKEELQEDRSDQFMLFLTAELEKKESLINELRAEVRHLNEKYADALKENSRLTQGVHLEARKLMEMMLPYHKKDSKKEKKRNKKKGLKQES